MLWSNKTQKTHTKQKHKIQKKKSQEITRKQRHEETNQQNQQGQVKMASASSFDLQLYVGKWFQQMCIPSWFQPANARNVTAEYTWLDTTAVHKARAAATQEQEQESVSESELKQKIVVVNQQVLPDGTRERVTGIATVLDSRHPDELLVDFWSPKTRADLSSSTKADTSKDKSFYNYLWSSRAVPALIEKLLPKQSANYIVYDFDAEYKWAIVGNKRKSRGWVLSRNDKFTCAEWTIINSRLAHLGFDKSKFVITAHTCF